jgi:hypothetical protein
MRYLALALLLAGCTTNVQTFAHWTIPGGNQAQMNADWLDCVKANTQPGTPVTMHDNIVHVDPVTDVNQRGANQCMTARGYTLG